mmetsp:Transcript_48273/g.151723  ORF Transcript_48273/g.151723 Transcript_48273/m.151723 type:complete len:328 (+) Transcript_48273:65-1048(+)
MIGASASEAAKRKRDQVDEACSEEMVTADLLHGLLPRPLGRFALPALAAGRRALVLGMGGGCDVIAALALARAWEQVAGPGATVLYATCISPRPLAEDNDRVAEHLWRCRPERRPLQRGEEGYGGTLIEQSLPRGPDGSPYMFVVPRDGKNGGSVEAATAENSAALAGSLEALRVETVLAVDLGGDSLTGGIDFATHVELGRDRQVLHALRASGLPFVHLVLGPGCDGESSEEAMRAAIRTADERGELLGVLPLDGVISFMSEHSGMLSPSRTPNILKAALDHLAAGPVVSADAPDAHCQISRHGNSQAIPWSWLTVALALRGAGER